MYGLIMFNRRAETVQFADMLKRFNVNAMVVSTPKGLGSACSVSIKFYYKDIDRIVMILRKQMYISLKHIFKIVQKPNGVAYEIVNINNKF